MIPVNEVFETIQGEAAVVHVPQHKIVEAAQVGQAEAKRSERRPRGR